MSAMPHGYAELERRDRRMFRRLIETAVFAGDHLKDAHDWVRELPDLDPSDGETDGETPAGAQRRPDRCIEAGPAPDPLPGPPRRAMTVPDVGPAADPFVPAAGTEAMAGAPAMALAMRLALAAACIAVAATLAATIL